MRKFFKILGYIFGTLIIAAIGGAIYFNLSYPKVSPASNIKIKYTSERIERGKYLANHVTACMDCHSTRNWNSYSGPIVPGTEGKGGQNYGEELGLPGHVYIRNITPAALKDWTDGEILRAVTSGVSRDGSVLFPVMPFSAYRNLSEEDLLSIIAYIRTLKPIENKVPKTEINFPVNMLIKTLPEDYKPKKSPDKSKIVEYGKYLVNIASCVDCHTPAKDGEMVKGMEFAGGGEFKSFPVENATIRSANITPDNETGIGSWTKENFIARFKSYSDNSNYIKVNKTDFNTPMPWTLYAGMTNEDLGAIYEYLKTLKPVKNRLERFSTNNNMKVSME